MIHSPPNENKNVGVQNTGPVGLGIYFSSLKTFMLVMQYAPYTR